MPGGETAGAKVPNDDDPVRSRVQAPGWRAVSDRRRQTESEVRPGHVHLESKTPNTRGLAGGRDESRWGTARRAHMSPVQGQPLLRASSGSASCQGLRFSKRSLKSILHREMAFYSKI